MTTVGTDGILSVTIRMIQAGRSRGLVYGLVLSRCPDSALCLGGRSLLSGHRQGACSVVIVTAKNMECVLCVDTAADIVGA